MVDLRHILGPNLKELEKQLRAVKNTIVVVNVQYVGTNWYINFLVQDSWNYSEETKKDLGLSNETRTKTKVRMK